MEKEMYEKIEKHMFRCMNDGAHDSGHIYRVLYSALDIAVDYEVDYDVLIAAALLHDIGRDAQYVDPECDHAIAGAQMAYDFLLDIGWNEGKAAHVKACIATHRYRSSNPPASMEARILFDADKLDATGTMGIARTLAYQGIMSSPLYCVDSGGNVIIDASEEESFFREYNWKLKNIYDRFFTERAGILAEERRKASVDFYQSMCREVLATHEKGVKLLKEALDTNCNTTS